MIGVTKSIGNMKTKLSLTRLVSTFRRFFGKKSPIYVAPCGTVVQQVSSEIEIPEGYELPKFNPMTGHAEYSDGTIAEHLGLRKIQ
jgi:hypothetical protein